MYPDVMHIIHLALGMDAISSVLLDLSDDNAGLVAGNSRDRRLQELWMSYRQYCEESRPLLYAIAVCSIGEFCVCTPPIKILGPILMVMALGLQYEHILCSYCIYLKTVCGN